MKRLCIILLAWLLLACAPVLASPALGSLAWDEPAQAARESDLPVPPALAAPAPASGDAAVAAPVARAAAPAAVKLPGSGRAAQRQAPKGGADTTSQAVRIALGLTVLAVLPALLVCLTSFLRIIIVLSMLRHAIGMPETPPNTVLIGLSLFMTLFTMAPVLQQVNTEALQPYMSGSMQTGAALEKAAAPLREFMVRQTREADLALMVELSKAKAPQSMADISNVQLAPAFMLSELRAAFQIGFVIFLPFLLIDLIVSSVLMALGMMMTPPSTISTPLKILMFILVDGWSLVLKALVGSFH